MRVEHVIYLSSAGCALWSWDGRCFAQSPVLAPVGEDPAAVVEEIGRLAQGPVAVLVDMIDEEHVRDVVPRLGRRDQQVLLERKLARRFPRTALRAAQSQGRSVADPDQDRVLLSGLTRPEPVRLLLERLAGARLPVAGVYSPALLAARLLDPGAGTAPAVMLVLRRGNGRQQHSLFIDGALAGSRRLRGAADPSLEDAGVMMRQLEESLRYFDPSFEPGAATPLELVLSPADHALLEAGATRGEGWRLRTLDTAALGRRLGLRAPLDAGCTERIFIELLRNPAACANYLPRERRRDFELFRLRSHGKVACLALAGAALAGSLQNALYILDARAQLAGTTGAVHQLESVLAGTGAGGDAGTDPLRMSRVVAAYESLERAQVEPLEILATFGSAVSRRPRIELDAIEWSAGPPLAARPAGDPAETGEEGEAGTEPQAAPVPATDGARVTLRGRVRSFGGDYPLAFDEVAAFVDALREDPAVEAVTPRVQPLDVSPASTLSGEIARGQAGAEAPFALEIVVGTGHDPA